MIKGQPVLCRHCQHPVLNFPFFYLSRGWRLCLSAHPEMGRRASGSSSSSIESSNHHFPRSGSDLSTDLRLGFSTAASTPPVQSLHQHAVAEEENECSSATFFVKVYMDGIPIGRKLDLLAHDGYHDMIRTLDHMFNTNILWAEAEVEGIQYENCHVLTYEDREGDWMMVGDVPWEMFLSCVRRLKITKC